MHLVDIWEKQGGKKQAESLPEPRTSTETTEQFYTPQFSAVLRSLSPSLFIFKTKIRAKLTLTVESTFAFVCDAEPNTSRQMFDADHRSLPPSDPAIMGVRGPTPAVDPAVEPNRIEALRNGEPPGVTKADTEGMRTRKKESFMA